MFKKILVHGKPGHVPHRWAGLERAALRFVGLTGSDFHRPGESYRDLGDLPDLPGGCTPVWTAW